MRGVPLLSRSCLCAAIALAAIAGLAAEAGSAGAGPARASARAGEARVATGSGPGLAGPRTRPHAGRALLLFLPAREDPAYSIAPPGGYKPAPTQALLAVLASHRELSLGLVSSAQGGYTPQQAVLDLSQGTRTAPSAYSPFDPPVLDLGPGGYIEGWQAARRRAAGALQTVDPGLLASSIPGGAGYVGSTGGSHLDAVVAADRGGHVAARSLGAPAELSGRARSLLALHRFVVADLPPASAGTTALTALLRARAPDELVIVMQTPPSSGRPVLPIALAAGGRPGGLVSGTTHLQGLVAGIDVAPTVLEQVGVPVPADMRGQRILVSGSRDPGAVDALRGRLGDIASRRVPTFLFLLMGWLTVSLTLGARRGWPAARRQALRLGALAFMWLPVMVLVTAALRPANGTIESLIITAGCFLLSALSDRLLPWPRAPALPAGVSLAVIAAVLISGSTLLATSLLGPDPSFGARFFGIGNELKSGLTVLALVGVAAVAGSRPASRRLAATIAATGVLLGVLVGSGRLGAGVGGVLIVAAATATAVLVALPGPRSRRALVIAVLALPAALAALAGLDLLTAGGRGHLSHDVLAAHANHDLGEVIARRYRLAYGALVKGMPVATAAVLLAIAFAWRNRWLYEPLPGRAWRAALVGGLAGGVVGALTEDSGPLLLVVAVFMLACVTAYLRGDPRLDRSQSAAGERAASQAGAASARPVLAVGERS